VPPARRTGGVDEALSLLFGAIPGADPRCGIQEMVKSLLDQRNSRIIAAAVEQTLQTDQPNFSGESRLIDSKIPRSAHESGRLGREVAGTTARHRANLSSFAAANYLPCSPRASIKSSNTCRRSWSGYRLAVSR